MKILLFLAVADLFTPVVDNRQKPEQVSAEISTKTITQYTFNCPDGYVLDKIEGPNGDWVAENETSSITLSMETGSVYDSDVSGLNPTCTIVHEETK